MSLNFYLITGKRFFVNSDAEALGHNMVCTNPKVKRQHGMEEAGIVLEVQPGPFETPHGFGPPAY